LNYSYTDLPQKAWPQLAMHSFFSVSVINPFSSANEVNASSCFL
jgi:hypothetical protein